MKNLSEFDVERAFQTIVEKPGNEFKFIPFKKIKALINYPLQNKHGEPYNSMFKAGNSYELWMAKSCKEGFVLVAFPFAENEDFFDAYEIPEEVFGSRWEEADNSYSFIHQEEIFNMIINFWGVKTLIPEWLLRQEGVYGHFGLNAKPQIIVDNDINIGLYWLCDGETTLVLKLTDSNPEFKKLSELENGLTAQIDVMPKGFVSICDVHVSYKNGDLTFKFASQRKDGNNLIY